MCGIVGAATTEPTIPLGEDVLRTMCDVIAHRGPDDNGLYLQPGIALGSRRLAILDLSERGHMPMLSPDGRYCIVHNGEVYNFGALRSELEARGRTFQSHSDTEVLLALYAEYGEAMLDRLNGMFAFAIWDTLERRLFIARDRLGVKPVYYAVQDGTLIFGSEEKALFAAGVPARFDPATWEELLTFLYVAGERTPFAGVQRLLPGHCLTWRNGDLRIRRWWDLGERVLALRESPPSNPSEWFRDTFDDAVALRRISDVPLGVLLSGGLDSSSVAASLARQAGAGVAGFTVRFPERYYDEGPLARQVADMWRLEHHELVVSNQELVSRLRRACWLNDEPLAHDSDLHIGAISHYAHSRVTVLLSGEGSDETLGGYVRYQPLRYPRLLTLGRKLLPLARVLPLPARAKKLSRFLALGSLERFVLFNSSNVMPPDLALLGMRPTGSFEFRERVLARSGDVYGEDAMRRAMFSDAHVFLCSLLDRNDRMTMGASMECRVPFLDYRLVEGLAALPSHVLLKGRKNKALLRAALGDRLPADVLNGRKWGFAVPWSGHLRDVPELRTFLAGLADTEPVASGPFDRAAVRTVVQQFLDGDASRELLVKHLFMIAFWHDAYFQELARRATARGAALSPSAA